MLTRQALGDRRAQLRRGAPHGIAREAQRTIALQRLTAEKRSGHLSSSIPPRGQDMAYVQRVPHISPVTMTSTE